MSLVAENVYLPIPAAIVTANMSALQAAYIARRKSNASEAAFELALCDVLSMKDRAVVLGATRGTDNTWPGFNGPEFGRVMCGHFESAFQTVHAYELRVARRPTLHIVDLAEDLATDQALASVFWESLARADHANAAAVIKEAARMLLDRALEPKTGIGRHVAIDQMALVVRRLGEKAVVASRTGSESAARQARWCAALHDALTSPVASAPQPVAHSFSIVGYCYNCATLDHGARLTTAVVTTELPHEGVVRVCLLCEKCVGHPYYAGWMEKVFPPPAAQRGRLLVQAIGICIECGKRTDMVADLTGGTGRRMAPLACSAACETAARRNLG